MSIDTINDAQIYPFNGNIQIEQNPNTPKGCSCYVVDGAKRIFDASKQTQAENIKACALKAKRAKNITAVLLAGAGICAIASIVIGVTVGLIALVAVAAVVVLAVAASFAKQQQEKAEKGQKDWKELTVDKMAAVRQLAADPANRKDIVRNQNVHKYFTKAEIESFICDEISQRRANLSRQSPQKTVKELETLGKGILDLQTVLNIKTPRSASEESLLQAINNLEEKAEQDALDLKRQANRAAQIANQRPGDMFRGFGSGMGNLVSSTAPNDPGAALAGTVVNGFFGAFALAADHAAPTTQNQVPAVVLKSKLQIMGERFKEVF